MIAEGRRDGPGFRIANVNLPRFRRGYDEFAAVPGISHGDGAGPFLSRFQVPEDPADFHPRRRRWIILFGRRDHRPRIDRFRVDRFRINGIRIDGRATAVVVLNDSAIAGIFFTAPEGDDAHH